MFQCSGYVWPKPLSIYELKGQSFSYLLWLFHRISVPRLALSRYWPEICLERLREFTKTSTLPRFELNAIQTRVYSLTIAVTCSVPHASLRQIDASIKKLTLWLWSARELYGPNDRCLSAKLVPTFLDIGCVAWLPRRTLRP
jgi:hypothetical protein